MIARYSRIFFTIFIALFVSACASTKYGNTRIDDVGRLMQLRPNESTKKDVFLILGQPHLVIYEEPPRGTSMWIYKRLSASTSGWTFVPYVNMVAGGSNIDEKVVSLNFDKDGTFTILTSSESEEYQNMWVGMGDALVEDEPLPGQIPVEQEMLKFSLPYDPDISK